MDMNLLQGTQKVLNALLTLEVPEIALNTSNVFDSKKAYRRDLGMDVWDWPQGVGLYGLEKLQRVLGDQSYDKYLGAWFEKRIAEGLPSKNVNTTAPYIVMLDYALRTHHEPYLRMCRERGEFLMNELPKTKEGGFQHVTTSLEDKNDVQLNEGQLWVDTLFMAVIFLGKAGVALNEAAWVDEAVHQILIHIKYLYEVKTGLMYHGWSFLRNDHFGGTFWLRGNSWFTYGMLELLNILGDRMDAGTRLFIRQTFEAQVDALLRHQHASGLWHTVIDDDSTYLETSGSAAVCAALYQGMYTGVLKEEKVLKPAQRALEAVMAEIDENGLVGNVSGGTAVGLDAQHYQNIPKVPIGYGQSLTAICLIEAMEFEKRR